MGIFSEDFRTLRRSLGLGDTPNRWDLGLDDYTRSAYDDSGEMWASLIADFIGRTNLQSRAPHLARLLRNRPGDLLARFGTVNARDPLFSRTEFFQAFDPDRYRKTLSAFERGERPSLYTRGYRTLGI